MIGDCNPIACEYNSSSEDDGEDEKGDSSGESKGLAAFDSKR